MTHPLQLILATKAWQEIETYYDHGRYTPTINVKQHVWLEDIPWDELRDEFGHHTVDTVKAWAEHLDENGEYDQLDTALEIAREDAWERAQEEADYLLWGAPKVYGEGRQGGHLVVHGIGSPYDWVTEECEHTLVSEDYCYDHDCEGFDVPDLEHVYAWYAFVSSVQSIRDFIPYMTGWHLIVNVHEPIHDLQGVI
jgi:hypothetical protein